MVSLALQKLPEISKRAKHMAIGTALFLPLVWFIPTFSWGDFESWMGLDTPAALASEMYRSGRRQSLSIRAIPEIVFKQSMQIAQDNECFTQQVSSINLGTPAQLVGYESVLRCPEGPNPFLGVYFDAKGNYLNTIAAGSD
jgi:hypothetical protein